MTTVMNKLNMPYCFQMQKHLLLSLFLLSPWVVFAQDGDKLDTISIEIVKEYAPTISDAYKKKNNPQEADSIDFSTPIDYQIKPRQITTGFEVEPVAPARIKGEPLIKLYKSYVKAGFGTQGRLYGEAFMNQLRSKKSSMGIHAMHNASKGNVADVGYSGYSNSRVNAYGKRFLRKHTLSGGLDFKNRVVHNYGYDPTDTILAGLDETLLKDSTRQRYTLLSGNVRLLSHYRDSFQINHDIRMSHFNLSDQDGLSENNFMASVHLTRYLNQEFVNVMVKVDHNETKRFTNTDTTNMYSNTLITIGPTISTDGPKYRFVVGVNGVIDINGNKGSEYRFYPNVYFSYKLINDVLIGFSGIEGTKKRNHIRSFSKENPFISNDLELQNSDHAIAFYGGFKGEMSSSSSFKVSLRREKVNEAPFFVNDYRGMGNGFTVVYDDIKYTNFHGEVSLYQRDELRVLASGDYYVYQMDLVDKPWHTPQLEVAVSGMYNLREKIVAKAEIFAFSSQYAMELNEQGEETAIELKGTVDVNAGLEYRYTKRLSLFLQLNNIAALEYNKWNKYPTQRFNLLGGLTYVF